eukprot:903363-Lingulodinium_polyedra.AAC.1
METPPGRAARAMKAWVSPPASGIRRRQRHRTALNRVLEITRHNARCCQGRLECPGLGPLMLG